MSSLKYEDEDEDVDEDKDEDEDQKVIKIKKVDDLDLSEYK